jgi:VanZ family protein
VPGRSCELRDVLIDTSGAVLAILCCLAIGALYRAKRKEKGKDLA